MGGRGEEKEGKGIILEFSVGSVGVNRNILVSPERINYYHRILGACSNFVFYFMYLMHVRLLEIVE